jgi:hypothetical protein
MTTDEITTLLTVPTMAKDPMVALALGPRAVRPVTAALALLGTANPVLLSRMCAAKYSAAVAVLAVALLVLLPAIAAALVAVDVDLAEVNN